MIKLQRSEVACVKPSKPKEFLSGQELRRNRRKKTRKKS